MNGVDPLHYWLNQADDAIKNKAYSQAIRLYEKALSFDPKHINVLNNLSVLYLQTDEKDKAREAIELAISLSPKEAFLYNQYANILCYFDELDHAQDVYQQALVLNPAEASIHNNFAVFLMKRNQNTEAELHLKEALRLQTDYVAAMINLALCYKAQGKQEGAVGCLLGILEAHPEHLQANFLLGKWLIENNEIEDGGRYFHRIAGLYPDDITILQNISTALLERKHYAAAKPYCLTIVDIDPNHFITWYNLGVIGEKTGYFPDAVSCYKRALAINPDYLPALNNLGVLYLEMQKTNEAKKLFEHALQLQPNNESLRYTLQAIDGNHALEKSPTHYIAQLFDQYADHFDQHVLTGLEYSLPTTFKEWIFPLLSGKPSIALLDLGCGTGLATEPFKAITSMRVGVDLSEKMIEQARQKDLYTELHMAEIIDYLQQESRQFDLIIAADVLVYLGNLESFFKLACARLSAGGLLAFSVETIEGINFQLQKTGRFAHSENYLLALAADNHLTVVINKETATRLQQHHPVWSRVFVCQR